MTCHLSRTAIARTILHKVLFYRNSKLLACHVVLEETPRCCLLGPRIYDSLRNPNSGRYEDQSVTNRSTGQDTNTLRAPVEAKVQAMITFRPKNLYCDMKRSDLFRIAFAALWIGLNASAIVPSRADSIPQLVAKTKPATVQILALDENWSQIKSGTGFFVSPDGLIVTNYHVIQGAAHLTARTNEGATFQFERVVAQPQGVDLAILKFSADGVPFLKLGNSTSAVEGQQVIVIGSPEGLQGTVSEGIISAFRENRSMIQITAPISHGSSGSPVLDENGQVIGVATLVAREGQNLGFAIAVEEVTRALTSPGTQPTPAPYAFSPLFVEPQQPSSIDPKTAVVAFLKEFWNANTSNDPGDWASDFAAQSRYCYSNNEWAYRAFVRADRAKLVARYPIRRYRYYELSIQMQSDAPSARISYIYTYSYSGGRTAAGSCRVILTVEWDSGRWQITDYDEKVNRQ
jgi:S1-C subfamily serine protease